MPKPGLLSLPKARNACFLRPHLRGTTLYPEGNKKSKKKRQVPFHDPPLHPAYCRTWTPAHKRCVGGRFFVLFRSGPGVARAQQPAGSRAGWQDVGKMNNNVNSERAHLGVFSTASAELVLKIHPSRGQQAAARTLREFETRLDLT